MKAIFYKELKQFFNSLTGIIAIVIFLILNGLFLFLFSETNLLEYGFVSLDYFFDITPFTLIFLIGAITMRLFAEEFKSGTFELLATKPLSKNDIVFGKFFASLIIVLLALLPTLIYVFTLSHLSLTEIGFDKGALLSSYFGLLFLAAIYGSVGLFCSSLSNNSIVAFLLAISLNYALYSGFDQIVALNIFNGNTQFFLENLSIAFHFKSIAKGVLDIKDLIYFISVIWFFIFLTKRNLKINK